MSLKSYIDIWTSSNYIERSKICFAEIDEYLTIKPNKILDIGCGLAHISSMFQKKYGSELWLLDGDVTKNHRNSRRNLWGSSDDFSFYSDTSVLKKYWDSQGILYNFVDASNIKIPFDTKFDFVCSWLSCGFHYPLSSYAELIKTHTNLESVIIVDLRRKTATCEKQNTNFEIVKKIPSISKAIKSHIRLL